MRTTNALRGLLATAILATTATGAFAGAEEGKALYEQKCKVCHSIGDERGKMADKGGPLDGVGAKRDAEWLTKYLRDPKSVMPDAKMPKMKMSDEELANHVAYMLSLK
jgi:nitric oxide reductase subunit C